MVTIKVGDKLDTSNARYGMKQDGTPWGFAEVKAAKGYDKISAWFVNPDEAKGRSQVEVIAINGVTMKNRKYTDKHGVEKWVTEYSADVTIKGASARQTQPNSKPNFDQYMNDFMQLPEDDVNDPGMPFA